MSSGRKRKRSHGKETCSICSGNGANAAGHIAKYCGFLGGPFCDPKDPAAGRKQACRQKRLDETAAENPSTTAAASTLAAVRMEHQQKLQQQDSQISCMETSIVGVEALAGSYQQRLVLLRRSLQGRWPKSVCFVHLVATDITVTVRLVATDITVTVRSVITDITNSI